VVVVAPRKGSTKRSFAQAAQHATAQTAPPQRSAKRTATAAPASAQSSSSAPPKPKPTPKRSAKGSTVA
jgi:hypothetical protein